MSTLILSFLLHGPAYALDCPDVSGRYTGVLEHRTEHLVETAAFRMLVNQEGCELTGRMWVGERAAPASQGGLTVSGSVNSAGWLALGVAGQVAPGVSIELDAEFAPTRAEDSASARAEGQPSTVQDDQESVNIKALSREVVAYVPQDQALVRLNVQNPDRSAWW